MPPHVPELIVFPLAFSAAFLGTMLLRRYGLAHGLVDVPNERSSHRTPTPRGGGVAIAVAFLLGLPALAAAGLVTYPVMIGLEGAGALVGFVGFLDDRGHVPPQWRLSAHFISAAWVLAWLGAIPDLPIHGQTIVLGQFSLLLSAFYLTWLINLYNFMDGIDGIAGVEAITVCLGAVIVGLLVDPAFIDWPALLLISSVLGFLIWNFPSAKIFMGDAGSGFLGLTLGVLSIDAALRAPSLFWSWVVLLGVFVVDASVTLLRRMWRREKVHIAHRTHAYQFASRRLASHARVTLAIGLINVCWLLPIASLIALKWLEGLWGVCLAYAPLIWLAYHYNAGARELQKV